ncbi:MAG: aldehyde dehydrogenase [Halobacteriales archaeon]
MARPDTQRPLYVDGEWHEARSGESIAVDNPATEETLDSVPSASDADVEAALAAAAETRREWDRTPAHERGEYLREMGAVLDEHREEIADLLVEEVGKPVDNARGEAEGTAERFAYVAEWDRRIEGDIVPSDDRGESIHLLRRPYGVVSAITPWNYPIAVFVRKIAPALLTGNTVVAKPSEVTPLAVLRLVELIDEHVDLPDGVLNVVTGGGGAGEQLVTAERTDMVTMTGHRDTGKAIMRAAAENLTEVSLELGGKAPAIVWKDADIGAAVEDVLTARVTNAGQVCTCAERVYVHSDVAGEFTEQYVDAAESLRVGDPRGDVDMGPQVSAREREKTERAVERAEEQGATVLTGGRRPEDLDRGYFYEPTVLSGVTQDMDVIEGEVFGPVTPIVEIDSLEEAIANANDSRYGLSSYVFTDDYEVAMRAAEEIEFGETYVNRTLGEALQGHHIGWKESGMGGEDGKYGVLKYTQLKTVYHNWR